MDQGIRSVQNVQRGLMAMHEPLLHVEFFPREEEAQPTEFLEIQHLQAVGLRYVPHGFGKYHLRQNFGQTVKLIGDDPIKHLDQEGELLQESAVEVIGKACGVWGIYHDPTALPTSGKVLGGLRRPLRAGFIIVPGHQELCRRVGGIGFIAWKVEVARDFSRTEYTKIPSPRHDHGREQDGQNHLACALADIGLHMRWTAIIPAALPMTAV